MKYDLCIIGGAGHVGLPLGVAFAQKRVKTVLFDIRPEVLQTIQKGKFPFKEDGGQKALKDALSKKSLFVSTDPKAISESTHALLVIGTPVDEYLNPDFNGLMRVLEKYSSYFRNGQTLILRSTIYPGTTERVQRYFNKKGKKVRVVFCPERIAQGRAIRELKKLPQVVSGFDVRAVKEGSMLFKKIVPQIITTSHPVEAELTKLFSNAWRYIKFAVANQFYMMATEHGLDYHKIHDAMVKDYERNRELPRPGFTAGPCLFKDTMQLAAFHNNSFFLGHSAMLVNEGLPNFLVRRLKAMHTNPGLKEKTVGILGMAFKADSDDHRDSLSYKLWKILRAEAREVLCHDVYIKDAAFHPVEKVLKESDIVILAAPHSEYKAINPKKYPRAHFVDIWNFWA